jgi:hypothetical protein
MNKQQIIEMTVNALSKGDYAIIRGEKVERLKELLKKLLEDKTDIVNFVPQDNEDAELEIPQNPVGYSYDRFIISEEQSDEQKICEMIECALGLSTVKAYEEMKIQ